jgi:hypothetical protein
LRGKAVRLVTQLYGGGCKFAFGRTDSLFFVRRVENELQHNVQGPPATLPAGAWQ